MINLSMDNESTAFMEDFKSILSDVNDATNEAKENLQEIDSKVGDIKNGTKDVNNYLNKHQANARSIVARAKNSICQFPVYISQTIRINEAQIIANMFERYYTTLVQAVISQHPIISEDEANNLLFLKHFHTNLKESANEIYSRYNNIVNQYYECIDDFDKVMYDSIFYTQHLTESCDVVFRVVPREDKDILFESHRLANDPLTGFIYLKEDAATADVEKDKIPSKKGNPYTDKRSSSDTTEQFTKEYLSDKEVESLIRTNWKIADDDNATVKKMKNKILDELINPNSTKNLNLRKRINDLDLGYDGRIYKMKRNVTVRSSSQSSVARPADAPALLRDKDIKKINNMDPFTMVAEFRIKDANGNISANVKYIIGVKTILHPIRTQDLSEELHELVTGNVKKLQKVRYKTGEITLLDYLFNIKGLKSDAAKNLNSNKRWINTLKRLGDYRSSYGAYLKHPVEALNNGSVPIPNGTLILSQPDVTTLTNATGIDLSVASNATKLAKSLFLICVAIVDSSAGTIKMLFPDNSSSWDVQSLAAIDTEVSKTDNSQLMKELNRMVNK